MKICRHITSIKYKIYAINVPLHVQMLIEPKIEENVVLHKHTIRQ